MPPRPASANSMLSTRPASALTRRMMPSRPGLETDVAGGYDKGGGGGSGGGGTTASVEPVIPPKLPQHIVQLLDRQQTHAQQRVTAEDRMLLPPSPCGGQDLYGTAVYARYPEVRKAYLSMIETSGHGVSSLLDLTTALKKHGLNPKLGAALHAQHIGPTLHQHQHVHQRPSTSPSAARGATAACTSSSAAFADVLGVSRRHRSHPSSAHSKRRTHHPAAEHAQHQGDGLLWRTLHTMG